MKIALETKELEDVAKLQIAFYLKRAKLDFIFWTIGLIVVAFSSLTFRTNEVAAWVCFGILVGNLLFHGLAYQFRKWGLNSFLDRLRYLESELKVEIATKHPQVGREPNLSINDFDSPEIPRLP